MKSCSMKTVLPAVLFLIFACTWIAAAEYDASPFGFHPAKVTKVGYPENGYSDAQNLGVRWTREGVYVFWFLVQPDLNSNTYDFSLYDEQYGMIPAGMNILGNIAPQGVVDEGYCLPNSYLPVDTDKYLAFVKAVVARYDGNGGAEDMPGLVNPIKYWQVGNEPNARKPGFAELQRITYTAIKEICPDCTVLIGGVPGMPPVDVYLSKFDLDYRPILDALAGNYVDIMDFHWYGQASGDYRGAKDAYNHINSVLSADGFSSIPFWITEMGAYSGDPSPSPTGSDFPLQTERQQALDYFKRFVYPLSFGVKKIFPAFGLIEGFKNDNSYFDHTGLMYDGTGANDAGLGVKKLSYYTYKKMTELLEGSDWDSLSLVSETDSTYVFHLLRDGKHVTIVWWDYFDDPLYPAASTKQISLSGLSGSRAIVKEVLPNAAAGSEVVDYQTSFDAMQIPIASGVISFDLGDSPVVVEIAPEPPLVTNYPQRSATPEVSICGTAEAGHTITVNSGETAIGSTTADGNGNWCVSLVLPHGANTLTLIATDRWGNESVPNYVTIVVQCQNSPLRRNSGGVIADATSVQKAYASAVDGDMLLAQQGELNGDLFFNRSISWTFEGGYDCDYAVKSGDTAIRGSMTIALGSVAADRIVLAPPAGEYLVQVNVVGQGTVTTSDNRINCGMDCSDTFAAGTEVTLSASTASGYRFDGWSGDPDCTDGILTVDGSRSCTATFSPLQARIYAAFVSHNERSPHTECDPVTTVQSGYLANRALTLQFADMIIQHGAAWDMQSDYLYLDAVKNWDTDAQKTLTNGKNLIQYLAELNPQRIVLDAHGHTESGPNYPDISYMHELMGAPRNGVLGGFIYYPVESEVWTEFENTVSGRIYPSVTWTVDILWGAATFQHQGPDSKASGIWRPKDAANFHVDDPNRRLVNIGGYTGGTAGLDTLLQKLHVGELEQGHMYTVTIFVNQCSLTNAAIQGYAAKVDSYAGEVASGNLVWATLPEMARIWRAEYGSTPTILMPDSQSVCGTCANGLVCCDTIGAPCYGNCVADCRIPGNTCPPLAPTCNQSTGICGQ